MSENKAPTVAYQLFHRTYRIEMQNKFRYHKEQLTLIPNFFEQPREQRESFLNDYTQLTRTPIAMVLLHAQGLPFQILYPQDLLEIHTLFEQHYRNWDEIRSDQLNNRVPPPDMDFIVMRNFSESIAHTAKTIRENRVDRNVVVDQHTDLSDFESIFGGIFGMGVPNKVEVVSALNKTASERSEWSDDTWGMIESGNI